MIIEEKDYLAHFGILRKSGRYPWGSGEEGLQGVKTFLDNVEHLRKQGLSETAIAKGMGLESSTDLRAYKTIAKNAVKASEIAMAQRLKKKGLSNGKIGEVMAINGKPRNESVIRALLKDGEEEKANNLTSIANMLKDQVSQKEFVQVGSGVENQLGVSQTKLLTAIAMLRAEGYMVHTVQVDQLGTAAGNKTAIKVLAPPGTEYLDIKNNMDKISTISSFSYDGGRSFLGIHPPLSIDSRRIQVIYKEDGGAASDGIIYVRPGVKDISLDKSRYAQVRIAVDGTHYMKGVAIYKDDLPPGVDLAFNTTKSKLTATDKLDALKPMERNKETGKINEDNPFGSSIRRQITVKDKNGDDKVTSAMNIIYEEGDWDKWSRNLSSQTLSKQSPKLAKQQLDITFAKKKEDLDEIMALTNPVVRKKLLELYAGEVDSSAVYLKAAALPSSNWQVLVPMNSLKENEIYAPNYRNGDVVALIRYPHGGTFEIPELVVNNRHQKAIKALGPQPKDAVAINSKVAQRLSGADFDGDAVLVVPNSSRNIRTTPALEGLKNFDPQHDFPKYEGMKVMTSHVKGFEMGDISNLITDMTIQGADNAELARAIRHSMVVIDAEKHELNWKLSAEVNGIRNLKVKYQGTGDVKKKGLGAATLISRARSRKDVPRRKLRPASEGGPIDPTTGRIVYKPTGESYIKYKTRVNPTTGLKENIPGTGVVKINTQKSMKLVETHDAHTLLSKDGGTRIEKVYADHSNKLKALANTARLSTLSIKPTPYSPAAKIAYQKEVDSLNAKLNIALMNRPLERQAQIIANTTLSAKKAANPDMDAEEEKKIKFQALTEARLRTGAGKEQIQFTPSEWSAIQAGAITPTKLRTILNNADLDIVKKMATPKAELKMTSAKQARAASMLASGATQAEVADALGVSLSTLKTYLK